LRMKPHGVLRKDDDAESSEQPSSPEPSEESSGAARDPMGQFVKVKRKEDVDSDGEPEESSEYAEESYFVQDYSPKELYQMIRQHDIGFKGCLSDLTLSPQALSNMIGMDPGVHGKFKESAPVTQTDQEMAFGFIALETSIKYTMRALGRLATDPTEATDCLLRTLPLSMYCLTQLHTRMIAESVGVTEEMREIAKVQEHIPRAAKEWITPKQPFLPGAGAPAVSGSAAPKRVSTPPATGGPTETPGMDAARAAGTLLQPSPITPPVVLPQQRTGGSRAAAGLPAPQQPPPSLPKPIARRPPPVFRRQLPMADTSYVNAFPRAEWQRPGRAYSRYPHPRGRPPFFIQDRMRAKEARRSPPRDDHSRYDRSRDTTPRQRDTDNRDGRSWRPR
jgi:hypothetical protein